ncbi:MAG: hypothetical protein ACFB15_21075 [Cyclobacteriaceae bacterium]
MKLNTVGCIIAILLLHESCNYRKPSKARLENITGISLSDSIIVTQDLFEESGPDYGLFYKVILNKKECQEISEIIDASEGWVQEGGTWKFYKTVDGTIYNITFTIDECFIFYREELL